MKRRAGLWTTWPARLPPEAWPRERIELPVREVVRGSAGVGDFKLDDYFVRDMGID